MNTIKRLAGVVAALALGVGGVLALASPAQAMDCKTVTTTLEGRPDSAVGGGTWALDWFVRTVTVCQVSQGVYEAEVTDEGTFVTQALDHTPAGVAQPLPAGIEGTFEGGFTARFSAAKDWYSFDASDLDGKVFRGSDGPSTGSWVKTLFGDDFRGSALNDDWSWTYRTWCGETVYEEWVNQTDTLGGNQGDVTSVPECPTPTPTPTEAPPTSEPPDTPEPDAGGGGGSDDDQLPVTGSNVLLPLAGIGGAFLVAGVVLVLALRRVRRPVRFTAE